MFYCQFSYISQHCNTLTPPVLMHCGKQHVLGAAEAAQSLGPIHQMLPLWFSPDSACTLLSRAVPPPPLPGSCYGDSHKQAQTEEPEG